MKNWQGKFLILTCLALGSLSAEREIPQEIFGVNEAKKPPFLPFTGKIAKAKVRLRASPAMDSPIIRELNQGELLVVEGEEEDFYAVKAPEDTRGFIFRTFVLEGTIEGNKVNVRLEPNTESPIIGQLNSGDRVEGRVSPVNNKWLEIHVPKGVHFYVSRDYVKKVGDKNYITLMQKKAVEVNAMLAKATDLSQAAYKTDKANFPNINYDAIVASYERVINSYPEFEEQKAKAETLLNLFKENYIKMKIAHLESKTGTAVYAERLQEEKSTLEGKMREQQERLAELEQKVHHEAMPVVASFATPVWMNHEKQLYITWMEQEGSKPMESFYQEQRMAGVTLRGTIEPYLKKVNNKPGDYVLMNHQGRPIAFLYSTQVNLSDLIGKDATIVASERANNDFALPAYFVLSIE